MMRISGSEKGFTLIEMLLALTILAILTGLAVLAIPNHDARYWRDNLNQLSASLNTAQDESEMSGYPMLVEINESGWQFTRLHQGRLNQLAGSSASFIPDAYKTQSWAKPVNMSPTRITLGDEYVTESLRIPIEQDQRQAILLRSNSGRFSWIEP